MIRRALIVDDEPLARERLAELVRRVAPGAELREVGDGDAAVEAVGAWRPEVVFLDVQMPGRDGFAVVSAVGADRMPPTVFVTAYDKHAIKAFDVAAVDYLLKPFDEPRFTAAWNRVTAHHGMRSVVEESKRLTSLLAALGDGGSPHPSRAPLAPGEPTPLAQDSKRWADRVVVKKGERTYIVKLSEIQWIESSGNYVTLHANKDKHVIRETLSSFESRLDPEQFVRIHRRVIIALDSMKELQPWFGGDQVMIMKDGQQLRVSRSYRERVARRLAGMA
jgi:two-component system LytT family response regulator